MDFGYPRIWGTRKHLLNTCCSHSIYRAITAQNIPPFGRVFAEGVHHDRVMIIMIMIIMIMIMIIMIMIIMIMMIGT